MSVWTHVAACIRFDGLRLPGFPDMMPDLSDPPEGSGGPLEVTVWENPSRNSMASWTVTIHGDLRDYGREPVEDIGRILDWLTRISTPSQGRQVVLIRQGICQVEVEGGPTVVLMWHVDSMGSGRWHSIYEKKAEDD